MRKLRHREGKTPSLRPICKDQMQAQRAESNPGWAFPTRSLSPDRDWHSMCPRAPQLGPSEVLGICRPADHPPLPTAWMPQGGRAHSAGETGASWRCGHSGRGPGTPGQCSAQDCRANGAPQLCGACPAHPAVALKGPLADPGHTGLGTLVSPAGLHNRP